MAWQRQVLRVLILFKSCRRRSKIRFRKFCRARDYRPNGRDGPLSTRPRRSSGQEWTAAVGQIGPFVIREASGKFAPKAPSTLACRSWRVSPNARLWGLLFGDPEGLQCMQRFKTRCGAGGPNAVVRSRSRNGRSHGHVRGQGSGLGVHGQFSGRWFGSKV